MTEFNLLWTSSRDIAISHSSVEKSIKVNTIEVKDSCTVFACSSAHSKINQCELSKINSHKLSESKFNAEDKSKISKFKKANFTIQKVQEPSSNLMEDINKKLQDFCLCIYE